MEGVCAELGLSVPERLLSIVSFGKGVDGLVELLGIFEICGLFTLHRQHNDLVCEGEFFEIRLFIAFGFCKFEALGEKIIGHRGLDLGGVFFFVVDPSGELVGIFSGLFREFGDLFHRFGNGRLVSVQIDQNSFIRVNPTRDLAMGREVGCCGKGE